MLAHLFSIFGHPSGMFRCLNKIVIDLSTILIGLFEIVGRV